MKKKYLVPLLTMIAVIFLELLPYGVVCNFAPSPGETLRKTFSYFSLVPFGYADFGPLLTAIISILIVLLILLTLILKKSFGKAAFILCIIAVFTSIMPLALGADYVSVTGICISVLLLTTAVLLAFINKSAAIAGRSESPAENT